MEGNPKITKVEITDTMKNAYLEYAMSVIIGRALPDARDGLKPVHRRILHAMNNLHLDHQKAHSKSARVVGDVIANFHPHGDVAIYDTLVRMAQSFMMRYQLVDGQGNFGSVDGDAAAAMRYTEVRMKKITQLLLADIDKNTVDFQPNYDNSLEEPTVLPTSVPNLLMNGSTGIAVGMATNIPPHNLSELIEALIYILENYEQIDFAELIKRVPGPDFPTAGMILGRRGIIDAYKTGHGIIYLRARSSVIEIGNRTAICVTELPYNVNKARLIEKIAELVNDKKITAIHDIRDESDREGMRMIIELKKGENPELLLNQLYKMTALQTSFGINMLAVVSKQPLVLNLEGLLRQFLKHRIDVIVRRTRYNLLKAEERLHILEGLQIALSRINEVIEQIKASKDLAGAKSSLREVFQLSEVQAQAILEMRLQRLTNLEQEKLSGEIRGLHQAIQEYKAILADQQRVFQIIKNELLDIQKNYGDDRKTEIVDIEADISREELIKDELFVVTLSSEGYLKRSLADQYQKQNRGGRGKMGLTKKDEEVVDSLLVASSLDSVMFFSTLGKVYWKKVYELPESSRVAKGRAIVNVLPLEENEKIVSWLSFDEKNKSLWEHSHLVMLTRMGTIKKTSLDEYRSKRTLGLRAIALDPEDSVVKVQLVEEGKFLFIATRYGMATVFQEQELRAQGRVTRGVRGIRLKEIRKEKDYCVSLETVELDDSILTVSENGFGKRSKVSEYRVSKRGNMGVLNMRVTEKTGPIINSLKCTENDELILISDQGFIVRISAAQISEISRVTQGVKLIQLQKGDKLSNISLVPSLKDLEDSLEQDPAAPSLFEQAEPEAEPTSDDDDGDDTTKN